MDAGYLIDGTEVQVISETKDGKFVVAPVYGYGDEIYTGDMQIVDRVFETPPTEIYSEQIKALQAEIDRLEDHRLEIKAEIEDAVKKENAVVSQIRDLLNGKFSHGLLLDTSSYGCGWMEIVPLEKLGLDRDNKNTFILRGSLKHGCWSWRTVQRDYHKDIRFCVSLDDAKAQAQDIIDEIARYDVSCISSAIISFAKEHELRVPQEAIDKRKKERADCLRREIESDRRMAKGYLDTVDRKQKELEELEK